MVLVRLFYVRCDECGNTDVVDNSELYDDREEALRQANGGGASFNRRGEGKCSTCAAKARTLPDPADTPMDQEDDWAGAELDNY